MFVEMKIVVTRYLFCNSKEMEPNTEYQTCHISPRMRCKRCCEHQITCKPYQSKVVKLGWTKHRTHRNHIELLCASPKTNCAHWKSFFLNLIREFFWTETNIEVFFFPFLLFFDFHMTLIPSSLMSLQSVLLVSKI